MDISDGEEIIDELELYAAPAAGGTALTPSFFDGSSSSSSASQLPCAAPDQEPMQMASERAVASSAPDCVLPVSAGENDRCRPASGRPKQHLPPTSSPPVNENDEETRRGATVDRSSSANVQERYSVPTTVPLMEELDAELLELIKNYYQRRQDPRTSTDGQRFSHTRANQHVDTSLTVDEMQQQHQPTSSTANPQPFPMNRDYCPWEQPVMPASLVNPSRDEVPATATPPHPERNRVADRRHENVTRGPRGQLTSLRRRQHQSHHYSDGQDALSHVLASNTTRTSPSATHDGSTTLADSYVPRFISYSSTSFVRAYVSDMSLNMEPALIVSGLAAALNIIVVYFLRHHVLDTRDHLGLFLIGSYLVFSSYFTVYYFLERFSSSFRRIASQDKKFYIIGNLLKAGILISIMPFAAYHLLRIVLYDEFETTILQNLGCIYSIPDFVSMIVVKRMRWSTWIHHLCVVVFNYFSLMNDYREENVCRCVVVYAGFSTFAYCVNVLLASRFLGVSHAVARVLSVAALVVYALCCATNWLWQVYYLRRLILGGHDHWTVYVYMALICLVMWDDMVLNKWLLNHARSTAFVASQKMMFQQQRRTANPSQDEM